MRKLIQLKVLGVFLIAVVICLAFGKGSVVIVGMFFALMVLSFAVEVRGFFVFLFAAGAFVSFLLAGVPTLKFYAPLVIVALFPYVKTTLEKAKTKVEFKKNFSLLEEEEQNFRTKYQEILTEVKNLEGVIEKHDRLYELSKEMEKVSKSSEFARKSLETFSLKLGVEKLAFFRRKNDDYVLVASSRIQADEVYDWEENLKKIKNKQNENFFKFGLCVRKKEQGVVMVKGKMSSLQIALGNVIASQVALGYERTLLYEEVEELSRVDGLTGLYLRKYFMKMLEEEINRAWRYNYKIAFLMGDLDDFKKYNDTYGHPMGDKILTEAASVIKGNLLISDFAGRYGGEEFCIFIPQVDRGELKKKAEKILREVEEKTSVTISIGISLFPDDASNSKDLIKIADISLYKAKGLGKNQFQGV